MFDRTTELASLRSGLYSVVAFATSTVCTAFSPVVLSFMRTVFSECVAALIVLVLLSDTALGGKPVDQRSQDKKPMNERTVFVTGSLIPQRIKLKRIGTTTVSPIRIIDRREIDATGRRTTKGILIADPSVRVVGH